MRVACVGPLVRVVDGFLLVKTMKELDDKGGGVFPSSEDDEGGGGFFCESRSCCSCEVGECITED